MRYKDEIAALRLAIKRTRKTGNPETGFLYLAQWSERHKNRDIKEIIKIYKKYLKNFFY